MTNFSSCRRWKTEITPLEWGHLFPNLGFQVSTMSWAQTSTEFGDPIQILWGEGCVTRDEYYFPSISRLKSEITRRRFTQSLPNCRFQVTCTSATQIITSLHGAMPICWENGVFLTPARDSARDSERAIEPRKQSQNNPKLALDNAEVMLSWFPRSKLNLVCHKAHFFYRQLIINSLVWKIQITRWQFTPP